MRSAEFQARGIVTRRAETDVPRLRGNQPGSVSGANRARSGACRTRQITILCTNFACQPILAFMTISDDVLAAGQPVSAAAPEAVGDALNAALNRFIGNRFTAAHGHIVDLAEATSDQFASLVHTNPAADGPIAAPSDSVAAVIDVHNDLTLENLRESYGRIAKAKSLTKTPVPQGETRTNITLGVVWAARTTLPLETITDEIARLNEQTAGTRWPDMIVVGTTIINYAVQFPSESLSGDYLPPAEGATATSAPAVYVVAVMRPTGAFTFNKMLAYLLGHLGIFSPGDVPARPNFNEVLERVPPTAVTLYGYQYNLRGDLVPVPRQFYNDRYLAPRPFFVESQDGEPLAAIQYLPWADGAAILIHGKLPLEGLLVFFGPKVAGRARVIRLKEGQISYVLPVTQAEFGEWLKRIQRQSNMRVKQDPGRFVVQKLADEGASSPYMARIFIGVLHLRDQVYPDPTKRDSFDAPYDYVTSALSSTRDSARKVTTLWKGHKDKVASGELAKIDGGGNIHVQESIDKELRSEIETFLNAATRCLKTGMQNIARELGANIGFLFQQKDSFEKGIAALQGTDPDLAAYLQQTRVWSEPMLKSRIDLEHGTWVLPRPAYAAENGAVRTSEPTAAGKPVSEFVDFTFDRLCCFVEEMSSHCLRCKMPGGVTLTEIPLANRVPEVPERFRIALEDGGEPVWRIASHQSRFEDT
jgi:hypothetical protein